MTGAALGAIYDGTGLGTDGTIWGGELLAGDLRACARVGHLHAVRMPGGARAVREPWRMACAWLDAAGAEAPPALLEAAGELWAPVRRLATAAAGGGIAPVTTSMGRLFDAVSAIAGVCTHAAYEGQAAVELEALVDGPAEPYPLPVTPSLVLDARPAVAAAAADARRGAAPALIAARFHAAVAAATAIAVTRAAAERKLDTAVLSGGVFCNRVLLQATGGALRAAGLRVLVPERVPPNDGGIAFGQAAVAAALTSR